LLWQEPLPAIITRECRQEIRLGGLTTREMKGFLATREIIGLNSSNINMKPSRTLYNNDSKGQL